METKELIDLRDYTIPYSESSYATEPTRWTKFLRTCILFQAVRFVVLNLKIMRIVVGGHS